MDPLSAGLINAALTYAKHRKNFGKPLASFQIIQQGLVRMLADVTAMQLYCVQIAKLDAAGKLADAGRAGEAAQHQQGPGSTSR